MCQPCKKCWRDDNRNRITSSMLGTNKSMYEERRLLVGQWTACRIRTPEIWDSRILSIVQQLIEDSATIDRETAAHNLAMLLPLFQNMDKYFKVQAIMEKISEFKDLTEM